MARIRVIPTLLLNSAGGLVKTIKFDKRTYIGDPINAVKIFNDKGADELLLLDIDATRDQRSPNVRLIEDIVSEAFMPVGYGGGIRNTAQIASLFNVGIEKVVLSTIAYQNPLVLREASDRFGSQSVVCCLDVKRRFFGDPIVYTEGGKFSTGVTAVDAALRAAEHGAGELLVYAINQDGMMGGYDLKLLSSVAAAVEIPVIACGGATGFADFRSAVRGAKCSAVAAGSLFVYQGKQRGVLLNYPSEAELRENLFNQIGFTN